MRGLSRSWANTTPRPPGVGSPPSRRRSLRRDARPPLRLTNRPQALDMLGFHKQLVFATFSSAPAFSEQRAIEDRYAAARAHNRAMADFCGADRRLHGVAALPLDVTALALIELENILKLGLKAV